MQPATGETFRIPTGEADHVGKLMAAEQLEDLRREMGDSPVAGHEVAPAHDLDAAIRSAVEHGPLVGVAGDVAHAQRLGQRELDRRKRRRKATKQARKHNR